jgi:hypothetical protein
MNRLQDLEEDHAGVELKKSPPAVSYRETVKAESSIVALSISQNKKNHMYVKAMPVEEELLISIEAGKVNVRDDIRAQIIAKEFGWDVSDARKLWCFGPESKGPNIFVDTTKEVQYLNEIKDSCVAAFQWATKEGVCAEENMRGIRFNLLDVTVRIYLLVLGRSDCPEAPCRCHPSWWWSTHPNMSSCLLRCVLARFTYLARARLPWYVQHMHLLLTSLTPSSRNPMPRIRHRWYLLCTQQTSWSSVL